MAERMSRTADGRPNASRTDASFGQRVSAPAQCRIRRCENVVTRRRGCETWSDGDIIAGAGRIVAGTRGDAEREKRENSPAEGVLRHEELLVGGALPYGGG